MSRQSLAHWIQEAITDQDKEHRITVISCVHTVGNAVGREVHSVKFAEGRPAYEPKVLEALFEGKCKSFAQDLPGQQTFCLLAFYGSQEPGATHPFVIRTTDPTTDMGLMSDAATPQGIVGQSMRHLEVMGQQYIKHLSNLVHLQDSALQTAIQHNRVLMQENREAHEVVFKAVQDKIEANNTHQLKVLEFARTTEERAKLMKLAPVAVNRITGKEIFPQSMEDTILIETMCESFTEDQIRMFASTMKPEAAAAILSRFHKHMAEKAERMKEAQELAKKFQTENPEHDATGTPENKQLPAANGTVKAGA